MQTQNARRWYHGSDREFYALPKDQREALAMVAHPNWTAIPYQCRHDKCRVHRGEIMPIVALNHQLKEEIHHGWWRFQARTPEGRAMLARTCVAIRNLARKRNEYDLWALGWEMVVGAAITSH